MSTRSVLSTAILFLSLLVGSALGQTQPIDVDTIMLSNEGDGFLIDRLVSSGYGSESLYTVLQLLQPYSGGAISPSFMAALSGAPGGSEGFTADVSNFTSIYNNPIGISRDGTLIVAQICGGDYDGRPGYTTYSNTVPGLGTVLFTYADDPAYYIDAGSLVVDGISTYYEAGAVIWGGPDTPPAVPGPSSLLLVAIGLGGAAMRRRRSRQTCAT